MALLNPPNGLPNLAFLVFRSLLRTDDGETPRSELLHSIALQDADTIAQGTDRLGPTLDVGRDVGLFDLSDQVSVALGGDPQIARFKVSDDRADERRRFKQLVRSLAFHPSRTDTDFDRDLGTSDFARAAAWYLLQSPANPPIRWERSDGQPGVAAVKKTQLPPEVDEQILRNDTRWLAFTRWSTYLGLTRFVAMPGGKTGIMPDPSTAIVDAISKEKASGPMPLTDFIPRLAKHLPVIDGGRVWASVRTAMIEGDLPGEGELSSSVSLALLRLHDRDVIRLESLSDAETMLTFLGQTGDSRVQTHVSISR